jgi:hypothetical protein
LIEHLIQAVGELNEEDHLTSISDLSNQDHADMRMLEVQQEELNYISDGLEKKVKGRAIKMANQVRGVLKIPFSDRETVIWEILQDAQQDSYVSAVKMGKP